MAAAKNLIGALTTAQVASRLRMQPDTLRRKIERLCDAQKLTKVGRFTAFKLGRQWLWTEGPGASRSGRKRRAKRGA